MNTKCPNCDQHLDCDDDMQGVEIDCPACNKKFTIPQVQKFAPLPENRAKPRADYLDPSEIQSPGEVLWLRITLGICFAGFFLFFFFLADEEYGTDTGEAFLQAASGTPILFAIVFGFAALVLKIQQNNLLGTGVRVTTKQYAWLHQLVGTATDRLKMRMPDVYIVEGEGLQAFAIGLFGRKAIVLTSKMVKEFSHEELLFVIGHELTHIKCRHTFWNALMATEGIGGIPILSQAIKFTLLHWSRRAEYTCDRGGFIACQQPEACLSGLVKLIVGSELAGDINLSEIVEQKKEMEGDITTSWTECLSTHPYSVNRIIGLTRYIDKVT